MCAGCGGGPKPGGMPPCIDTGCDAQPEDATLIVPETGISGPTLTDVPSPAFDAE